MAKSVFIWSIGHSNHTTERFITLLKAVDIEHLVDIRSLPRSRFNPQFNGATLATTLMQNGIDYTHMQALGGMRKARTDSENTAFRDGGFRGYADYMQTSEFQSALDALIRLAGKKRAAIMCAEAKPGECHRLLVSDALTVRGHRVNHILKDASVVQHTLHHAAHVAGTLITYPGNMNDLFSAL